MSVVGVHWNPTNQGVEKTDNYSGQSGTWIQDAGWIFVNSTYAWYYNLFSSICKQNISVNHCWSLRALGVSNRQKYPLDRQPTRLRVWATQGFQYLVMVLTIHWKETSCQLLVIQKQKKRELVVGQKENGTKTLT